MPNPRGLRGTGHGGHGLCLWTQTTGGELGHIRDSRIRRPHTQMRAESTASCRPERFGL